MRSLLGLLLLLAAPGEARVKNPDTFVYAVIGDVNSLDPAWQYDGISHAVQYQVYENLVFYDGASTEKFVPMLSSKVPSRANGLISKDGRTYRFPIREGVRFHDGSPLTPEDVKYSLMRFLLTDRASGPSALLLEPILGILSVSGPDGKPDPAVFKRADRAIRVEGGEVVIRLREPSAAFLSILAGFCPIISKPWTIAQGAWDGTEKTWRKHHDPHKQDAALYERSNGTGPFRLKRWDKKNKLLILTRNDRYWRRPAALKRVVFKTVDEPATRKLMLQAGDADAIFMERQYLPQVRGLKGVRVEDGLPFLEIHNVFIYNFNIKTAGSRYVGSGKLDGGGIPHDFFADLDVRKGLAHAFNYGAYIRDGYRGQGRQARGPIPRGVFGYNPDQPVRAYDPKKAARHFKKAFGGKLWEKGFKFTISYMEGRSDRQLACQILKREVEALNPKFAIEVRGILWSTYLSAIGTGRLPIVNARWGMDFADPHNAVHPFLHSKGHYAKRQGYSNPEADRIIEKALSELDPRKRQKLYHRLQAIAYEDIPQIYTIDTYYLRVTRDWVKDWTYNPIIMYGYLYPVSKKG